MWWLPDAACIGRDPELFFPVGTSDPALAQTAQAKRVCGGCAVRADCLEWSLVTCQDAGVWGGLDEEERRAIRRARRRGATIAAPARMEAVGAGADLDEFAATG
ncbi:MAG TPA: WhiB family transcriptional regulator [Actinomycetota bacterium]